MTISRNGNQSKVLSPAERETIILYDMESRKFTITTAVPKHQRKFLRLWGPGKPTDSHGTMRWVVSRVPVLSERPQKTV